MARSHRPAVAVGIVVAAFAAISAVALATQRAERLYGDAQKYQAMSVQFSASRRPIVEQGPFVYRVGVPWLASALQPRVERAFGGWQRRIDAQVGMGGVAPFFVINIVAALAASVLLLIYVMRFVPGAVIPVVLVIAWMATWHAPVRFVHFYPVNVDAAFLVVLLGALLTIETTRHWPALASALAVTPVVFAGTLVRESMVVGALAFAAARLAGKRDHRPGDGHRWAIVIPFAAWVAGMVVVRQIAVANPPYEPIAEAAGMAREKPVFTWVLAWFFTFGAPAIALLAAGFREAFAIVRTRPEIGLVLVFCGLAAFFGGSDTERILAWSAPAVYVLVGTAIDARWQVLTRMPLLIAALVLVQVASSRALWPIPVGIDRVHRFADLGVNWQSLTSIADKFLVIDNYYSNLWSFYGSRTVHAVTLFFDLAMTAVFALSIERFWRLGSWR